MTPNSPLYKDNSKLRADTFSQLPVHHRNQQLFSDYYLNVLLPSRSDWKILANEAKEVQHDLQHLFASYTPSTKEAQTEDDFIKPVLRRLGLIFEVQPTLETPDGTKTPDYMFYHDQTTLAAHKGKKLHERLLQNHAFAVGDAKYWDRPLDVSLKNLGGDLFTNKNPSYQIAFYMQHSGVSWGILTNGRLWRLYHKDSAHKLDRFYEVDLPALLQEGDVEPFLYFYAFFRRQAFETGTLSLESIRIASIDYARGISDSLKSQVYEALSHVAQGFLDYPSNYLQPTPDILKAIYDNSLIVLYRLLFILYAEARELLPISENADYRDSYSLASIKKAIRENLLAHKLLLPNTATLWSRLKTLFSIVDEGSPPLSVATFNGGLFDPKKHPFLEQYAIGDRHLQQAIDKLVRVDEQFIDYRDLAERHLGTIYEGLLEFHLEALDPPEDSWTIGLKTAKGERKTTGSYYTPDYIVKYMVEETLGPMLHKAIANASSEQEKIQAVLSIKVLDPAMGSGHFLVEVTEYIARFLIAHIEQLFAYTGTETELVYWKRRVVQACIYGIDLNPLAVDLAKLSLWLTTIANDRPFSFLDHHLRCGNSLIGTRLADLKIGTTSTKKSSKKSQIRDTTVTQSMLFDENSLRQQLVAAVNQMGVIEASSAQTVAEVKSQEQAYIELRQKLTDKYRRLANIVSGTHFGLTIDQKLWKPFADYATGRITIAPAQFETWLQEAATLSDTYNFFHWELEFPEVFFDRNGQPKGASAGFDAVIGNPPYVRQEELSRFKPYFAASYQETYDGVADLYVYFCQQGLRLVRTNGRMSYIVTNKWMRAGYGKALRTFFAQENALDRIIDFGHAPIFEDAEVFPCIVVLEKTLSQDKQIQQTERQVQVLTFPQKQLSLVIQKKKSLESYIQEHGHCLPQNRFGSAAWNLEVSVVDDLIAKIRYAGVPLTDFTSAKIFYGIKTGLNEAFLIDSSTKNRLISDDPHCTEVIKPYLRGQDVKRWVPEWADLWMIVLKSSSDYSWPWSRAADMAEAEACFQQVFPSLYKHLKPLEAKLRARQDKGRYWWELRSCTYYHVFEQPKIMYQEIQHFPAYCFDDKKLYSNNKVFFLAKPDMYLLGVLNSPLMWWYNWRYLPHMINDTLTPVGEYMEALPIARPTDALRAETEKVVKRIIEITRAKQEVRSLILDWLRTEFDVQEPGRRLESSTELDMQTFVEEIRKRRPKSAGKLTPAALKVLQAGYTEQIVPTLQYRAEAALLERKVSDLVNDAYGLTSEEIDLLRTTAPPRMPLEL